jgi:hypothetical protein
MSKCTSLLGHSYQARYDTTPPENIFDGKIKTSVGGMLGVIEAMTKHIYVCDVCTRCGHVVKREDKK